MDLHRRGRDYFELQLSTTPAATGWRASFDKGATWFDGAQLGGASSAPWSWLVAGPDYVPSDGTVAGTDYATVARTVDVLLVPLGSTDQNPFVGACIFVVGVPVPVTP